MIQEFKTFIMRGNVIDLAIGVVMGGAFGKIVNSMVADIIMPPIGLAIGKIHFKDLKLTLGGTAEAPVTLNYGNFIQVTVEFLIISFAIFLVIKAINALKKKEEAKPVTPPEPSAQEKLLAEIRDLLKKN
ncbi:MAG: large-conductance mechanosensitive channel protein MscL [Flammeovirgaceae bacterium]